MEVGTGLLGRLGSGHAEGGGERGFWGVTVWVPRARVVGGGGELKNLKF